MASETDIRQPITVTVEDIQMVQRLADALRRAGRLDDGQSVSLMTADGQTIEITPFLLGALQQVVELLAQGDDVALVPMHHDVSLSEAATLLNVSQPFLLGLLDAGEMTTQGTGDDRRIPLREVVAYKARRHARGLSNLSEALRIVQEAGSYD
jgi:excisionase family DNA binding protein